ncbi:hypothetical protein BVC80_8921g16 [Macleaya cordata]|uniref:Uncharacterized protein n=1 Tax=Macleaya cordata TaxID=56857 RepID=A0A200PWA4_MACCD|nr:hypothetical protein BVC80_8921g16 [Macleaya cordata]
MRCKKHLSDRSSSVGVCASCLRERLFALVEAQARAQALAEEDRRKSDPHPPHPPPLIFPRSVSPYICRRSDDSSWHHHNLNDHRFYSTPQVGPTTTATATTTATNINTAHHKKKKHSSKFNLFSNLFRTSSRSEEPEPEPEPIPDPRVSTISRASLSTSTSSPISSTWFSSFIPGRLKKQSPSPSTTNRRPCRTRDRGMSPSCEDEDYDYKDAGSPSATSGYLSESSPGWRKSAAAAQSSRRKGQSQNSRSVSGMAFCLSPLVRASPKSHRSQKDCPPGGTIGFSGEIGWVSNKPNLSTAASFCANRSRKLANFGRYNYNP